MKIVKTALPDVLVIEPDVYTDKRGFFLETYRQERYAGIGINEHFVQDNLSGSVKYTLRGLHFQVRYPQSKLVQTIMGDIFDVAVDMRADSATFGNWAGVYLSGENRKQLFIPAGFAHGFCVLSDTALVSYKSSENYHPEDDAGIRWSDPELNIAWPIKNPILSEKDSRLPLLSEITRL
ncbi:MAG: dTDP-4-dehydrorhamnose 3,5-epimerase [Desulfobacterales bacterium]